MDMYGHNASSNYGSIPPIYSPTMSLPVILPRPNVSAELELLKNTEEALIQQKSELENKLAKKNEELDQIKPELKELKRVLKDLAKKELLPDDFEFYPDSSDEIEN